MVRLAYLGCITGLSAGRREYRRHSGILGNRMNPGGPSPAGPTNCLRTTFLQTGSVWMNIHNGVVHRQRPTAMNPADVKLKLRRKLKAVDPELMVMDTGIFADVPWSVGQIKVIRWDE